MRTSIDRAVTELREGRRKIRRRHGPLTQVAGWLDDVIQTDRREHLDDPDFPTEEKVRMVQGLHRLNVALLSYRRFLRRLRPLIEEVARRRGGKARLLELASGSGEFSLNLAAIAARSGLPLEVTGSDYIPDYVTAANSVSEQRGVDARFRVVNAFDMSDLAPDSYDLVFTAQSMHHFSPGDLGLMIAQTSRVATTAFIGIDGYRSVPHLAFIPGMAALMFQKTFVHDAWITARRLYSEPELSLIGELAAPDAVTAVDNHMFGFSVLTVRFD